MPVRGQCGEEKEMKKKQRSLMILLLICSMLLYGCGSGKETAVQDTSDAGTEATDDTGLQDDAEISGTTETPKATDTPETTEIPDATAVPDEPDVTQQPDEPVTVFLRVIHTPYHSIFKRNSSTRFFIIFAAGRHQFLQRIPLVDRHDLRAGLIVRRMEGDRKGQL